METQLIIDWRLAQGLTFTAAEVALLAHIKQSTLLRMRGLLGFTHPYEPAQSTLGEALTMLALTRAGVNVPRNRCDPIMPAIRAIVHELDDIALPLPEFFALTLENRQHGFVVGNEQSLLDALRKCDAAIVARVEPLTLELCNGTDSA